MIDGWLSVLKRALANKAILDIIHLLGKTRAATQRALATNTTPSVPTTEVSSNPCAKSTVDATSTKQEPVPVVDLPPPPDPIVGNPRDLSTSQVEDGENDTVLTVTPDSNVKEGVEIQGQTGCGSRGTF
ncbi:hypothetical protein ONZ45_g12411 [Pleurotus djamor]|nr:hypothetical protein ONZ45_g12411 [Pleurotus djamor]